MTATTRILIVDDEPQAIQVLFSALGDLGDLRFALSGAEALEQAAMDPPDLVILDARMPGMDGFATCAALKARHPDLPVLFVTAASDPDSELRALEAGAGDFIVKPIHPPLIRARVEVHLRLRRQQQQYQATVTQLRHNEAVLDRIRADLEEAQALAHIGSWTLDIIANTMEWSAEVYRISGLEPGTPVTPETHFRLIHPEDLPSFESAWQATLKGAPYDITHRIIVDGQVKWVHARAEFTFDPVGQPRAALGTLQDVTAQKEAQVQIEYLAYNDPLTGLLNRAAGQERLAHDLAAARRHQTSLVLLYLDLDRFKFVNDRYGHGTGDLLLQGVTRRLRDCLRGEDALCRLSGDEFMILLKQPSPEHLVAQVSATCDRILSALVQPFSLAGHLLTTSFSIGVAVYPQDGQTCEALMHNADTALYAAKKAGRNGYRFFEPRMNAALGRFTGIRDALRRALDQGEFELHYQPQLDLRTGRAVGVEALVRWRRPGMGLLLPDDFLQVAEESGLILPLGRWVLQEACRQAARWQQAGLAVPVVALNLSALQFHHAGLDEEVRQALATSGLEPSRLELELTETTLLQPHHDSQFDLAAWQALGLRLAIDDYGTGQSSVSHLKRHQVDRLKIDRSFTRDLTTPEEDRTLVPAMIQLAHALRIRTLAEGVENATQAHLLQAMGCDEAQGYLYAKPLPAAEAELWLQANRSQAAAPA